MGFKQNAYARIFTYDAEQKYGTANITISRKNKTTNEYEVEFQDGFVRFIGEAHKKAVELGLPTKENYDKKTNKGVSIQITSCDVTNKYDSEKRKLFTNYLVYDFEIPDNSTPTNNKSKSEDAPVKAKKSPKKKDTDENKSEDEELPF